MSEGQAVEPRPAQTMERAATGPGPARTVTRAVILGALGALLLGAILGVPLLYAAYRTGRSRGVAAERERAFEKEIRIQDEPFAIVDGQRPAPERPEPPPHARVVATEAEDDGGKRTDHAKPAADETTPAPGEKAAPEVRTWIFGPAECARVVWPMEIVASDDDLDRPHFRLRQGANRFAARGTGLAEFVFSLAKPASVGVYLRVRYSDECGNSIRCGIDGRRATNIGSVDVFNRWQWDRAYRRFRLGAGLHRLTLGACEDGVEFDRVVVTADPSGPGPQGLAGLVDAETTPPPVFESMPRVSPTLPGIAALEAGASATGSIVAGEGQSNQLTVFAHLNGEGPANGRVVVRCSSSGIHETRPLALNSEKRSEIMTFDLNIRARGSYVMPLRVEVFRGTELVHSQRIDFIRPLEWAFLGPFPDPEGKGLDLELPPDTDIWRLRERPAFEGREWKVVRDGSCYDDFGLVDINKVFGLDNVPWSRRSGARPAMVAYAVTAIRSGGSRHDVFAFGGDDDVKLWLNGSPLLEARGHTPIELNRQVVGTALRRGPNFFVFKVAQRGFYWQVLMEPDNGFPYGRTDNFTPLSVDQWAPAASRNHARGRPVEIIVR